MDPTKFKQQVKYENSTTRNPSYSRAHNVVPRLYVPEWKTDMKNRKLIVKNTQLGNSVAHREHDENLFLDKREQMSYNVEDRIRVDGKYQVPDRAEMLRPQFHHESSRYQSELMQRRDTETCPMPDMNTHATYY
ncbi:unnamed protein product [Owenia fusiformis]|uniref:Uncharacterized protein n=1 Tax=Owenia fusiformis TaxID=6347 RepID=A0A8S4PHB6_OWEFU|nr:unnamed protein product [Owenia fusiformis]